VGTVCLKAYPDTNPRYEPQVRILILSPGLESGFPKLQAGEDLGYSGNLWRDWAIDWGFGAAYS